MKTGRFLLPELKPRASRICTCSSYASSGTVGNKAHVSEEKSQPQESPREKALHFTKLELQEKRPLAEGRPPRLTSWPTPRGNAFPPVRVYLRLV
jgi:hypothetical protein